MTFGKLGPALVRLARNPAALRALVLYALVTWVSVGFWGYSVAMRAFLNTPRWMLAGVKQQFAGPVAGLSRDGVGSYSHFRFKAGDSPELALPPEIADPLWAGSPRTGQSLEQILRDGQLVAVSTTGGLTPVVLELSLRSAEAPGVPPKEEKLLDAQDSLLRLSAVRAHGETKATAAEALAGALLPLTVAVRRVRAWRKRMRV